MSAFDFAEEKKALDEVSATNDKALETIKKVVSDAVNFAIYMPDSVSGNDIYWQFVNGLTTIIMNANGVLFGGYVRDLIMLKRTKIPVQPNDLDVLVKEKDKEDLLNELRKHCKVFIIPCRESTKYSNLVDGVRVETYMVKARKTPFCVIRPSIKMDCVIYNGSLTFRKVLNRPDFNVNTLYMSHGAVGAVWVKPQDLMRSDEVLKQIYRDIENGTARYFGPSSDYLEYDFNRDEKGRKMVFKRTMKMLLKGFQINGLNHFLVIKDDEEDCVICAQQKRYFIGTKCCKGISCTNCFTKTVRSELNARITYRCMFHRDESGSGYSVVPKREY
jgi:hypothetical protein